MANPIPDPNPSPKPITLTLAMLPWLHLLWHYLEEGVHDGDDVVGRVVLEGDGREVAGHVVLEGDHEEEDKHERAGVILAQRLVSK